MNDARLASMALDVGSTLDPVTLDAALRLGSLRPADVGSGARDLVLRLDDQNGFTMRTQPASWTAVFGFYTPTLRTTDLIPGQVRLLRSLLAGREDAVAAGDPRRRPQRDLRAQGDARADEDAQARQDAQADEDAQARQDAQAGRDRGAGGEHGPVTAPARVPRRAAPCDRLVA